MAQPATRQGLIDYCLRALGSPVIEINVDEDQLEDRVDEAIQYYREYHGDAVVRNLRKQLILNSAITVDSTTGFEVGELIVGQTSKASAIITSIPDSTTIRYNTLATLSNNNAIPFQNEVIEGGNTDTTATISAIAKGDIENGYVEIPNSANILSINNVFNVSNAQTSGIFSVDYQIHLNDIFDLKGKNFD